MNKPSCKGKDNFFNYCNFLYSPHFYFCADVLILLDFKGHDAFMQRHKVNVLFVQDKLANTKFCVRHK